ncbi:hypothetical protein THAOC_18562 [Thalassiosira oceanica]|uniref:Uncharacterized protein n=1 Tax=Thalassiosira oceanica TaxID=159749 RepID=K0SRQ3_THAOC|nr:hypothetical protein THAOC_18562 [Thalassiosira oceanica]|eukprot:EJK61012.1 hypothetical protein THAOC_18562 [Thalassiosira oceanica]
MEAMDRQTANLRRVSAIHQLLLTEWVSHAIPPPGFDLGMVCSVPTEISLLRLKTPTVGRKQTPSPVSGTIGRSINLVSKMSTSDEVPFVATAQQHALLLLDAGLQPTATRHWLVTGSQSWL